MKTDDMCKEYALIDKQLSDLKKRKKELGALLSKNMVGDFELPDGRFIRPFCNGVRVYSKESYAKYIGDVQ